MFAALCTLLLAGSVLKAQEYFPPGVLGPTAQEHESHARRYTQYLKALHEPSLWELSHRDPKAEAYRFLWLRSFHHPISVRFVLRRSGSSWLYAHMTSGKGGYQPGRMIRSRNSWQTKGRTASFLNVLQSADFWNLPVLMAGNAVTVDGAEWLVEGVRDGQYRVVVRTSPDSTDSVRAIGLQALKLGRFRVKASEIY